MTEADERAWVAFASAALGGLHASGYSSGRSPHLVAAEQADDMLAEAAIAAERALASDLRALLSELDAVRRERDALLDAARDVLDEAPEHVACVPRSGCAYAVLRAAVEACGPKEGT